MSHDDISAAALAEIAAVKGQLANITLLIQAGQSATQTRIEDLRRTFESRFDGTDMRFDGVERRLGTIEQNERGTAIRTAAIGACSGAIVAASISALRHLG